MTTKEFIQKANQIHQHKYDYSKTVYVNSRTKIQFGCPIHGLIEQNPKAHLKSCGCPSCASNKMTTKLFIEKAKIIHKNKYNYINVKYKNARNKILILCPTHGEFKQKAGAHLAGQGCPQCSLQSPNRYKKDLNHFIKKSQKIHGNKYNYSKTEYLSSSKSLIIICPIHGEFKQRASAHTSGQGCPKCNNHNKITKKEFMFRANKIHNNKYNYSKSSYRSLNYKIKIICPIHGEFKQKASAHIINKNGCPKCGYQSMKSSFL